jgi:hypothetical protein
MALKPFALILCLHIAVDHVANNYVTQLYYPVVIPSYVTQLCYCYTCYPAVLCSYET